MISRSQRLGVRSPDSRRLQKMFMQDAGNKLNPQTKSPHNEKITRRGISIPDQMATRTLIPLERSEFDDRCTVPVRPVLPALLDEVPC